MVMVVIVVMVVLTDGGIIGVDVCDDNILNIPLPRNGSPTPVYLGYRYPVDHNDLILVDKDQ
jgi:hypothetical protein